MIIDEPEPELDAEWHLVSCSYNSKTGKLDLLTATSDWVADGCVVWWMFDAAEQAWRIVRYAVVDPARKDEVPKAPPFVGVGRG